MFCAAQSFVLDGFSARPVRVEVDLSEGLPGFHVAGIPAAAIGESRERVRAALVNSGFEFPLRPIVVNVSPAIRSASPGLDLAIALALLGASEQVDPMLSCSFPVVGELALDGSLRGVPGALPFARAASGRCREIVVPTENGSEATLAKGIEVLALDNLRSLSRLVCDREARRSRSPRREGTAC